MRKIYSIKFIVLMLFSLQSCYVQKPDSLAVSSKDYNERQNIDNPIFVQRNNPIGIGLQIVTPLLAGAAMYQYVDPVVKYQDGAETKGFKPANAAIGVVGMLAVNKLINYAFGYNTSKPITEDDYQKWMIKTGINKDNNYIVNNNYTQFTIIPKKNESHYEIKNIKDVLQFNAFYKNASDENVIQVITKATPLLEQNDLLQLIELYPNYPEIYPAKKKYIVTSPDYNGFWARTTLFPEVQVDQELLSSDYVANADDLLDYLSKYPSSPYLDKVKVNSYQQKYSSANLQNKTLASYGLFEISEKVFRQYARNDQKKYHNYFEALFTLDNVKSLQGIYVFYTKNNWLTNLVSSQNKLEKAWEAGYGEYADGDDLVFLLSSYDQFNWGITKREITDFIDGKLTAIAKEQVKIANFHDKRSTNEDLDRFRQSGRAPLINITQGVIHYLVYGEVVNNSKFSIPVKIESKAKLLLMSEGLVSDIAKGIATIATGKILKDSFRPKGELPGSYDAGYLRPHENKKFAILYEIDGSHEKGYDFGFDIFSIQYAERVKLDDYKFIINYDKTPLSAQLIRKQNEWLELINKDLKKVDMQDVLRNTSYTDSQNMQDIKLAKAQERWRKALEEERQLQRSKSRSGTVDYQVVVGKKVGVLRTGDQNYFSANIIDGNKYSKAENYSEQLFDKKGKLLKKNTKNTENNKMETFVGEYNYPLTLVIGYVLNESSFLEKKYSGKYCRIVFYAPGYYRIDIEDLENVKK